MSESDPIDGWAIVELFGHRRLAGRICQVEMFGAAFLRLDIPGDGPDDWTTQLYGGAAVFCVSPCSEAAARAVAARAQPEPVHTWELPRASEPDDPDDGEEELCPTCGRDLNGMGECQVCDQPLAGAVRQSGVL